MSHISTRVSAGAVPILFTHFPTEQGVKFTLSSSSKMQRSYYSPNHSTVQDNGEHRSPPYAQDHFQAIIANNNQYYSTQMQVPQTQISSDDPRRDAAYGMNTSSGAYRGQAWPQGIQQPVQSVHSALPPHPHDPYSHNPSTATFQTAGDVSPGGHVYPTTTYISTESPRLRTAQACQKCRVRKAKVFKSHLHSF